MGRLCVPLASCQAKLRSGAGKTLARSFNEGLEVAALTGLDSSYRRFAMLDSEVDISRSTEGPWHHAIVELAQFLQHGSLLVMRRVTQRGVEARTPIWLASFSYGFFDLPLHHFPRF